MLVFNFFDTGSGEPKDSKLLSQSLPSTGTHRDKQTTRVMPGELWISIFCVSYVDDSAQSNKSVI